MTPIPTSDPPREHQLRALYLQQELRGAKVVNRVCLAVAGLLLPVLLVNAIFVGLTPNYYANLASFGLFAAYSAVHGFLLRKGVHHPVHKYLTITLLVTLVTITVAGYAPGSGWVHALRSCTLVMYFLALALAGLFLSPKAALFAGALAVAEYTALFLWAALGAGTAMAGMETFEHPALSWDLLAVYVPVFLMVAGAIAGITRQTRFALVRAVYNEANVSELEIVRSRLETYAWYDVLTGLSNRRRFEERFTHEMHRVQRYHSDLSLLILDIDHFKHLNDTHGHSTGDRVLVAVARGIAGIVRQTDLVARWGGEEFVILCPDSNLEAAHHVAEKVRRHVEALELASLDAPVTISVGVTDCQPNDGLPSIVDRADNALYAAKQAGRNRVGLRPAFPPPPSVELGVVH